MDKTAVKKMKLGEESPRSDLAYWLSRPAEERIEAVEMLRWEYYGNSARLKELLTLLNRHKVEYVIIGAYALAFHGVPRNTGDIDLYVRPTAANAGHVLDALNEFGFSSLGLTQNDFDHPGQIIQLGNPPVRIDLITSISGVSWEAADAGKAAGKYGDVLIHYLGKAQLMANKRASGRKKDLADLEALGEE